MRQHPTTAPNDFNHRLDTTITTLKSISTRFTAIKLASSLAAEDMVLTDLIARHQLPISIFTLNTGRLHQQTLDMVTRIKQHYQLQVELVTPNQEQVEQYAAHHGLNAFYDSVELRKLCCQIRKVEPLARTLASCQAWVTGQRRDQSVTRSTLDIQEHDTIHSLEKFNPLASWSEQDVWYYIDTYQVPYNVLHDTGYPSIGCEPCTRAIQPGEDVRAGRWWWENADTKECGLHVVDGKLVRKNQF